MRFFYVIAAVILFLLGTSYFRNIQHNDNEKVLVSKRIEAEEKTLPAQPVEKKNIQAPVKNIPEQSDKPAAKNKFEPIRYDDSFMDEETRRNRSIINEKVGQNYIDSILVNGKVVRWNPSSFPLAVYIENSPNLPPYYYQQIRKAFERWQAVSNNFITFKYTMEKDKADIRCYFPSRIERKCGVSNVAAWHSFKFENNLIKFSDIKFAKVTCQKTLYSPETIYATALHEIGHSLGISGHSTNPSDLMYPVSSKKSDISENDMRTLRLLYSIIPDVTNVQFSQADKNGLITSEDVWGSKENRVDLQLQDIKHRVNNVSAQNYSEYVKMGSLYAQKNDYDKALKCFEKALEFATDDSTIAVINSNISSVYYKLKDYESALQYAEKSHELNPDDESEEYIAHLHFELGNYSVSKSMLRNLLNRNPKMYNSYKILCNIYLKEKDYKSAMSLYERGKRYFPENPPINLNK